MGVKFFDSSLASSVRKRAKKWVLKSCTKWRWGKFVCTIATRQTICFQRPVFCNPLVILYSQIIILLRILELENRSGRKHQCVCGLLSCWAICREQYLSQQIQNLTPKYHVLAISYFMISNFRYTFNSNLSSYENDCPFHNMTNFLNY